MINAKMLINTRPILGEGPVWDEKRNLLYWTDGLGCKINIFDPETKINRVIQLDQYVGSIVLKEDGNAVVALQNGFYHLNTKTEELRFICDPESNLPNNRLNDGKCDSMGRFWTGSMNMDANEDGGNVKATGQLYFLDAHGNAHRRFGMLKIGNGIGWNKEFTKMYYIDSPERVVWSFDFDAETGSIGGQQVAADFGDLPGIPDGMCVDEEGMLWVCHYDGYMVSRWNPASHEMIDNIELPVKKVTCCSFGGESFSELFIITSSIDADETEQEYAGGLFVCTPGVKGFKAYRYVTA